MTIPGRKGWYVKNGPFRFPIDRPEVVDGHESIRLEPHPFYHCSIPAAVIHSACGIMVQRIFSIYVVRM